MRLNPKSFAPSQTISQSLAAISLVFAGALLALAGGAAKADHATLSLEPSPSCYDLLAGQTIYAGDVCVSLDGDNILVEYQTADGWELSETHVWVGDAADGYPQTKKGNPQVGKFPYNSGDLGGLSYHSETVPLAAVTSSFEDLYSYCGAIYVPPLYLMAHAAIRRPDGSGGFQTETGWSAGAGVVDRGSWATRSTLTFSVTCDTGTTSGTDLGSETAWVFGASTFDSLLSCGDDNVRGTEDDGQDAGTGTLATRWGWSVGPVAVGDTVVRDIYAAAGLNDLTKGSLIGTATITNNGSMVSVTLQTDPDYAFTTVQAYVGDNHSCTVAPGQLGFIAEYPDSATEHTSYHVHDGGDAYLAIHLDAVGYCDANDNFCE